MPALNLVTIPSWYNERFHQPKDSPHSRESHQHGLAEWEIRGRLIPSYPSYFDQYLGDSGELHIHFRWLDNRAIGSGSIGGQFISDYCIVLSKLPSAEKGMRPGDTHTLEKDVSTDVLDAATDVNKFTMLIGVFDTADDSEHRAVRIGPQAIRLRLYNQCPSFRSKPFGSGLKILSPLGVIDHEVSVFVLSPDVLKDDWEARLIASLPRNGSNHDMVECTSQVVYEISEHDGHHRVRLLSDGHQIPDFSLAIRQPDSSKLVRMVACVPQGFSIDVYHVLLGTLREGNAE